MTYVCNFNPTILEWNRHTKYVGSVGLRVLNAVTDELPSAAGLSFPSESLTLCKYINHVQKIQKNPTFLQDGFIFSASN